MLLGTARIRMLPLALSCYLQRAFPFEQGRMRVIKTAVERMWSEIAEIFFAQFAQCSNEWLRFSHCRTRKRVRLVFETARPDVNDRRNPETYRTRQQRKQQHRRNDIRGGKVYLRLESERMIKPLLTPATRSRRTPEGRQRWKGRATSVRGAFCNAQF